MLDPEAFGDFDACRRASLCHCVFIVQVLIWILNVKVNVYAYLGTDDMSGGGEKMFCKSHHTLFALQNQNNTSQTIVKLLFQPHLMFQSFLFVRYVSYTQSVKLYLSRETHK